MGGVQRKSICMAEPQTQPFFFFPFSFLISLKKEKRKKELGCVWIKDLGKENEKKIEWLRIPSTFPFPYLKISSKIPP